AEERGFVAFRRLGGPMLEELAGNRSDAWIAACAPAIHLKADVVNERVELSALAGRVKVQCLLGRPFLRSGNRDERLARPSAIEDQPCGTIRADFEMTLRRAVRRV